MVLESCRAHSHHVSIITVINFMQVFASGSLESRIKRLFTFSASGGIRGGGIRRSQEELQINVTDGNRKAGKLVRNLPE